MLNISCLIIDSTKTIRLLALNFYEMIVDSGFALINYGDMIRDRVRILYLLFLWSKNMADVEEKIEYLFYKGYTYEEAVGLLSVDYGPWLVFIVFSWIMKTRTSTSPYQEIKGSRHGGL